MMRAAVFYGDARAGTLAKTPAGYEFQYDPAYLAERDAAPVSLALPLRPEKYASHALFPFFEGLLPEGWLLEQVCAASGIGRDEKLRLLLQAGRDPAGAVRVLAEAHHG
jgi:serine/threonine-protein kinase HipA